MLIKITQVLVYLLCFSIVYGQTKHDEKLDKLIKEYKELPFRGKGISKEEIKYSDSIRTFKAKAIAGLLEMLKDDKKEIVKRASFAIRKIDGLNKSHLDDLIEAMEKGETRHAIAIASIGGNKAISALIKQLFLRKRGYDQITYAFKTLEEKGVPYLVNVLKCKEACDNIPYHAISQIFRELGDKGASGVDELSKIAFSEKYSIKSRQYAIYCIGHIKQKTSKLESDLNNLSKVDSTNFYHPVFRALTGIKSNFVVDRFTIALENAKNEHRRNILLRDIAALGVFAKPIGKEIIKHIKSDDWETRVAAIHTLGYINYTPSLKYIIEALKNEYDCRLNYVAINSLVRMKAKSALPDIKNISKNHWFPAIREKAKSSIKIIEKDSTITRHSKNFAFSFFAYYNIGKKSECQIDAKRSNYSNLTINSGRLTGTNRGEFGGELVYINEKNEKKVLLKKNVHSIHRLKDRIIVITGLSHLFTNTGTVYQLDKNNITPQIVVQLPSAPIKSKKIDDKIIVQTSKGIIEFTDDFKLKLIDCSYDN